MGNACLRPRSTLAGLKADTSPAPNHVTHRADPRPRRKADPAPLTSHCPRLACRRVSFCGFSLANREDSAPFAAPRLPQPQGMRAGAGPEPEGRGDAAGRG